MSGDLWEGFVRRFTEKFGRPPDPPPPRPQVTLPPCPIITPEAALAEAVQAAGADAARIAHWLTSDRGPVYRICVPGEQAIDAWHVLRKRVSATRMWPLVLGDEQNVTTLTDWFDNSEARDTDAIVARAAQLDLPAWFKRRRAKMFLEEVDWDQINGEWLDEVEPTTEFTVPRRVLTGEFKQNVYIAILPTTSWWEAAAVMRYGGWNASPGPEEHVALHRHWNERHGAELVCMREDVLEFRVARPPTTREHAMELANEQFDYCNDIVMQGVGTIAVLAGTVLNAPVWYFWWD